LKGKHEQENDNTLFETITLRLPMRLYSTSYAVAILRHYEDYNDYVCDVLQRDLETICDDADNTTDTDLNLNLNLRKVGV
jgi:hypothetical protein